MFLCIFYLLFWQHTRLSNFLVLLPNHTDTSITHNQFSIASEARILLVFILLSKNCRKGSRFGHDSLVDGMLKDGLWDVYSDTGMGVCAELCADNHVISREEQVSFCTHIVCCKQFHKKPYTSTSSSSSLFMHIAIHL